MIGEIPAVQPLDSRESTLPPPSSLRIQKPTRLCLMKSRMIWH